MLKPRNTAILGATGFVGATIARSLPNAVGFNSRNVGAAENAVFDELYCAAAPGSMFEANRYPTRDAERIDALIGSLSRIKAERVVLISTIAVLDAFDAGRTEADTFYQERTPYGVNRRRLEVACQAHFPGCLIVRLPALFGPGLMKNFIFDLMNPMPSMLARAAYQTLRTGLPSPLLAALDEVYSPDASLGMHVIDRGAFSRHTERYALAAEADRLGVSAMMFHNRDSTFQFYEVSRLVDDISIAMDNGLDVVHLATAPLKTSRIYQSVKGQEMPATAANLHAEDMQTLHAQLWGSDGPYLGRPEEILDAIRRFCLAESMA